MSADARQERHEDLEQADERFRPLRPAGGIRLVLAFLIGPVAWIVAIAVAAWIVHRTDAIEFGALVTLGSFVVALPVLVYMHHGRNKEEREFDDRP